MNNFSKLGLSESICKVLNSIGFEEPTPIQEKAIPLLLSKDPTDCIGLAQTGTGKTAAFGLPLIDLIDSGSKDIQALIIAPTRELVQQTATQLESFSKLNAINIECVYGGANIVGQIKSLKRATQMVVATPGRLQDLIDRKALKLDAVRYVVLDEADEMLNMGFKEAIDKILSYTPEHRKTWLFSATMPGEIKRIVKTYMHDPIEVTVNAHVKTNTDIAHQYVVTKTANKTAAIRRFLDMMPDLRGVMFCRTKRETQQITDELTQIGYGVEALHGDLSQAQRDAAMKRFKARSMQLLIATDVAARGIDVNDLTHVFHHTLPDQLESYTHRSGRTGRAGKKGVSLALINPREGNKIKALEQKLKVTFEKVEVPNREDLLGARLHHWASLIINTKIDEEAETILHSIRERFAHLSKEELLKRLITTQLDHILTQDSSANDLNERPGEKREVANANGEHRYFVNIGTIDGLTQGDLIHFISDISEIKRKHFGNVEMKKNCAYFYVDGKMDSGLSRKFEGVEIEGREIRVNRDDTGRKRDREGKKSKPKMSNRSQSRQKGGKRKNRSRGRR